MSASPRFVAMGALCAATLALAACSADPPVDRSVALVLSDGAERLADHLAADKPCRALAEAAALLDLTSRSGDEGLLAAGVAAEVEGVVSDVTRDVTCERDRDRVDDERRGRGSQEGDASEQAGTDEGAAPPGPAPADDVLERHEPAEAEADRDHPDDRGDPGGRGEQKGKAKGNGKGKGKGKGKP